MIFNFLIRYITDTEFQDRKAQLIDLLTGTNGASRKGAPNNLPVANERVDREPTGGCPRVVPSRPPNFSLIESEAAIRHEFNRATQTVPLF